MDELLSGSRWFQMGLALGVLAAGVQALVGPRASSFREALLRRLHLVHAGVIAFQALGHMTAITIRADRGTLTTIRPMVVLYGVGLVYLIPAIALAAVAFRARIDDTATRRRLLVIDVFLAIALIVAIFPGPLAIPAILNIVALRRDTPGTQRNVLIATTVIYVAMFVASFFFDGP